MYFLSIVYSMQSNVHTNKEHIVDVLSRRSGYSSALLMFPYNYLGTRL